MPRRATDPLRHVRIASPCPADWAQMAGDDRVRYCSDCKLNVYNLSAMTRAEAERLLAAHEGRICVRFYRRKDGTILTENCPVGLGAIKRRLTGVAAACLSFAIGVCAFYFDDSRGNAGGARQLRSGTEPGRLSIEPSLRGATMGVLMPRQGNHPAENLRNTRIE
jgi:hypothetical protein